MPSEEKAGPSRSRRGVVGEDRRGGGGEGRVPRVGCGLWFVVREDECGTVGVVYMCGRKEGGGDGEGED